MSSETIPNFQSPSAPPIPQEVDNVITGVPTSDEARQWAVAREQTQDANTSTVHENTPLYRVTTSNDAALKVQIVEKLMHSHKEVPVEKLEGVAKHFMSRLEEQGRPEDSNTAELLTNLPITSGISIGGQDFFLSEIVRSGPRDFCVGYVDLGDQIAPRLFYKSRSQGDWRVSPDVLRTEENGRVTNTFSKGETMDYGYARETQINNNLAVALESKSVARTHRLQPEHSSWLMGHFTIDKLGATNTYSSEAFDVTLSKSDKEALYSFKPGHGFEKPEVTEEPRSVFSRAYIDPERTPDFREPIQVSISEHPVLGEVTTEKYIARDSLLVWNISHDQQGRVWVSGASGALDDTPNSYGTDDEVMSLGIIDNKPLEYREQVNGLEAGIDYQEIGDRSYVDITPLLDNLPLIKEYRVARGIQRQAA